MTPDVDFDLVLEMFQRFGPERATPIRLRWREAFPDASEQDLSDWDARCQEIEREALVLAEQFLGGTIDQSTARERLAALFPELGDDRLRGTMSQAYYFASK